MKSRYLKIKKIVAGVWIIAVLSLIGFIFWYNDLVYLLPTPIPQGYSKSPLGKQIVQMPNVDKRLLALNFYNPDCPCSRFNVAAIEKLYLKFGNRISFVVVVLSNKKYTAEAIKGRFHIPVDVVFNESLALACGVYSTPQLVLLNADNRLYYRGNYNQSRYCINEKTNYARIAMQNLIKENYSITLDKLAFVPYGCQLPVCNK